MSDVESRLKQILGRVKRGAALDAIRPDMDLTADLDLGSAEVMELLASVEDEFALEINEVDATRLRTVADVVGYIESRQGSAPRGEA